MNHQIAIISLLSLPCLALEPIIGHIDIDPSYNTTTQLWTWRLLDDDVAKNPEQSFMPGRDIVSGPSNARTGERYTRPASSTWDFIGTAAGQNVWIYTQSTNGYSWLGFADAQNIFTQPLQLRLAGVDGPPGGHFSLYFTTPSPQFYMSTSDGISSTDVFPKPLEHNHINWAFTRKGMWRVRLTVNGFIGSGTSQPTTTSQEVPLYFAIGHRAQWRANHYSHSTVMNEAIASDFVDADGDGMVNLLEYAFGGNPTIASALSTEHGGPLQPALRITQNGPDRFMEIQFYRRRAGTQPIEASYEAQFSSSLAHADWQTQTITLTPETINPQWERVTVRDSQPLTARSKRFARIRITPL
ncbi:MAG TPA: hypothetical protein DDW21_05670 [Verrucomicrobiales bacterium]|nr:hypothetical protein [Verrucomicrobiales bacterium]